MSTKDLPSVQNLAITLHETSRIMRCDPEVAHRRVGNDAAFLISHATEQFVEYLVKASLEQTPEPTASDTNAPHTAAPDAAAPDAPVGKVIEYDAVKAAVATDEKLEFLRPVFP